MTRGPGKYDKEADDARVATGAEVLLLAVLGGKRGNGFSVQSKSLAALGKLPRLLRIMAEQIEEDLLAGDGEKN